MMGISLFAPGIIASPLSALFSPIWKLTGKASVYTAGLSSIFTDQAELERKNRELSRQLEELSARVLDRNLLIEENLKLKEMLGRAPSENVVLAGVLSRPPLTPYDTFILDAGSRETISLGDTVLFGGTVAIGYIDQVFTTTSRARLYSAPGEEIQVHIEGYDAQFTAIGRGGGNFEMKIPKEIDNILNKEVITTGIDQKVFGIIEYAELDPSDAFQIVLFRIPVNTSEINRVLIERGSENSN